MGKSLFESLEEPKKEITIDQLKISSKLIPIKYKDIVFNPLTQLSCQNCGFFGRTFRCPPYNTPYYMNRENLKKYNNFVLIVAESELSEYERRFSEMKAKCPTLSQYRLDNLVGTQLGMKNLGQSQDDLKTLSKFIKSKYTEYKFYGSAGCHKCRKCSKWLHKPCEYPLDSFSSPEGSGIDLYETLRKKGIYVESPPIKKYLACCMSVWKE